jgi:hypothetical protein
VYQAYDDLTNLTTEEVSEWAASSHADAVVESDQAVARAERLLSRERDEWTMDDLIEAKRAVQFISGARQTENALTPLGAATLRCWGHDPVDEADT